MQKRALDALAKLHERQDPRALLVSATGTGKTYLSAFDVAATRPKRVLFLVHRQRILAASMASYRKLLGDAYTYGIYSPGMTAPHPTCLFAMCSTISRHLDEFDPNEFDYIIIDEAHRTGSASYQKIMEHFRPTFYLGMTATPTRTDGYDVFALFNHVIAFQITLQDALRDDMLAPFHYFGIADLDIDDEAVTDLNLFSKLTSDERVRHITEKIEEYTVAKKNRRGLIFCNRNDEATELSRRFNELGYRTCALSGSNSDAERDAAIARLESGELEYIFSVDIFNEGVDIPSLNQIIMLRRTESAIVFVQQLGRGLRKAEDKEYALVLDFIGNYQQNFFVPIALSGDRTYNKDNLRAIVKEGSAVIPGCSTVSFDEVSKSRIYKAIDGGNFSAAKLIRDEYASLRNMLGRIPTLEDFDRNGAIDPLRIFKKFGSYHEFLSKYEPDYQVRFTDAQANALEFISRKLANGKRLEDLAILRLLVEQQSCEMASLKVAAERVYERRLTGGAMASALNLLSGAFGSSGKNAELVERTDDGYRLASTFADALANSEFKRQVLEALDFGAERNRAAYANGYKQTNLVLNAKYTYEEVCCYLGWKKNINGQNIGGYKYDADTNTYPVFINYDKDPDISDTIKYEDRFVSESKLIAISKQPRDLSSPEIQRLKAWPGNGMKTYLFVRKNKDDKDGGKEFYFLGEMHPTQEYKQIKIADKNAVEITYELDQPVEHGLYSYLISSIDDETDSAGNAAEA
jgi:superfamily II DNA or RNA helicase